MHTNDPHVILITGATCGVGRSLTRFLLNKGYCVLAIDKGNLGSIRKENTNDRLYTLKVDLLNADNYKNIADYLQYYKIQLSGMFLYAGLTNFASLTHGGLEVYDQLMDINLKSSFFLTQLFLRFKSDEGGSIVYTGSIHQFYGEKDRAVYAISKGALRTLNQHVAKHYSKYKIRSNILVLGWTRTEGEVRLRKQSGMTECCLEREVETRTGPGRLIEPCEYNEILEYLLSDRSKLVTGSVINASGERHG